MRYFSDEVKRLVSVLSAKQKKAFDLYTAEVGRRKAPSEMTDVELLEAYDESSGEVSASNPAIAAHAADRMRWLRKEALSRMQDPIPMLLWCPGCGERHIDSEVWATKLHHTHACQECGMVWRPAVEHTVGVMFLPGFKNGE